jgi:hypothetical protein
VEPHRNEPLAGLEGADLELTAITLFLHRAAATLGWPLDREQRERLLAHLKAALTEATTLRARLHKRVNAEPALAPRLAELTRDYDAAARAAHVAASAPPAGPLLPGGPLHDDWRPPAARAINTAARVARLRAQDFVNPSPETEACIGELLRETSVDAPLLEEQWRAATEDEWRAHLLAWTRQTTTARARANVQAYLGTLDPVKVTTLLAQRRLAVKPAARRRRLPVATLVVAATAAALVVAGGLLIRHQGGRGLGFIIAALFILLRRR